MHFNEFTFHTTPDQTELLIADLEDLPFNGFEEHDDGTFTAYIATDDLTTAVSVAIDDICSSHAIPVTQQLLPDQNWNAIWEASFQPIEVGSFCGVRAAFHPANPNLTYDLIIDPRRAFGTGHHETTYMLLAAMQHDLPCNTRTLLDYGCGTGILAILAAKLGALHIDAIDIEEPAYLITAENAILNHTPQVTALHGTLDDITRNDYEGIFANITRNIILESLPRLYTCLQSGGWLALSGFHADTDAAQVLEAATRVGFKHTRTMQRGIWAALLLVK